MGNRTAWILTLGNEVVQGRVINTNAAYLGRRLTLMGFNVLGNISLIDDVSLISKFIKYILNLKPSVIVTSGGLGPTYDDRTLEAVALACGLKLELNRNALNMVREKYSEKSLPITEDREKMAYLPHGAEPIPNPVGTAPGSWLEIKGTIIISLPGVPRELEAMWESWVEPRLRSMAPEIKIFELTFRVKGIPESTIAPILKKIIKDYNNVYVKTHPKGHEIRSPIVDVYILASANSVESAREVAESVAQELKSKLKSLGGIIEG